MFTLAAVKSAFATEGFHPSITFDTQTASAAQIERIAPPTSPNAGAREGAAYARAQLEELRQFGATHPVTWLEYRSASEDGGVSVFVWGHVSDAEASATSLQKVQAKLRAKFEKELRRPHTTGYVVDWVTTRLQNVVVEYSATVKPEARRARAAIVLLARNSRT